MARPKVRVDGETKEMSDVQSHGKPVQRIRTRQDSNLRTIWERGGGEQANYQVTIVSVEEVVDGFDVEITDSRFVSEPESQFDVEITDSRFTEG